MKIALPIAEGKLCMHFGHCEQFALIEVDEETKKIVAKKVILPPPHEPGVLPEWLHKEGVDLVIAGGMGQRAQSLFAAKGIKVVVGVNPDFPERLVAQYLEGNLETGQNVCNH